MAKSIAVPLSRQQIRNIANIVRRVAGAEKALYFDIVHFLDVQLPRMDPSFLMQIVPIEEMKDCHGLTYPNQNIIMIREDVYNRAEEGSGRDRLTMAHELFHLLQHSQENTSFARSTTIEIVPYRDPEWQANAFGGELLVPMHLTRGLTVEEIELKCGVSHTAAKYQHSCIH